MPRRNWPTRRAKHGSERRQKGKGGKRRRRLHHGAAGTEARNWERLGDLPDLGTGADPNGEPVGLRERTTKTNRGSAMR